MPHDEESKHNRDSVSGATPIYDDARRQLLIFVQDLAGELNDAASLRSLTSRLANLYHRSGLTMAAFIEHLSAARATTKERTAAIRATAGAADAARQQHKLGYCFAVLEDQLGLREQIVGDELLQRGCWCRVKAMRGR